MPDRIPTIFVPSNGRWHSTVIVPDLPAEDGDSNGRVQAAVADAVRRRIDARAEKARRSPDFGPSKVLPKDVRKRLSQSPHLNAAPPRMRTLLFTASLSMVLMRLLTYSWAAAKWTAALMFDKLRRRDTIDRRAERLRHLIEEIGGTAVKLGQQAAMRIDLVPYAYAMELAQMLDRVPPFPVEYAIERIEAVLGRPMHEVFEHFDPKPIGSASVATVYQAYLRTGERVAIKVRRPGIGEQFAADCRALGLVLRFMEMLTIMRPGLSSNFLFEFSSMLLEELDFAKEARYGELFRRHVRKHLKRVSAPRVFFDFSGTDVLVTEFVTGVWLRELLAAVETKDLEALKLLEEKNIDPKVVAKKLIRTNQFCTFEGYLFHADPHPANVVIQPNNRVVFIDFGSCGAYTSRDRNNWRQLAHYQQMGDVARMVQGTIALLEPLPPIDLDEFAKKVEMVFWQDLYAHKSKHAQWWERTSARVWIAFLEMAREYNVPMHLNTLRMLRSTLLYETIAARLYPKISAYKEFRRYQKAAGERARTRVQKRTRNFLTRGLKPEQYLEIEQLGDLANRAVYMAQRFLNMPEFRFSLLINKAVFAVTVGIRTAMFAAFVMTSLVLGRIVHRLVTDGNYHVSDINPWQTALEILTYKPIHLLILLMVVIGLRRILFRFMDVDVHDDRSA